MTFTTLERVVLLVLVAATIVVSVRDLAAKIRLIRAGKPDRVRTDQVGRRLGRVVKEVLFQSRVLSGRPIVGAMHAAVFFAFLLFALETTDHFLEPFGVPFLAFLGGLLPIFRAVLAVLAVLCAIAIAGLAFRRFVLVSQSPNPKSYESGVVAAMIFVLMLTYLNGMLAEPVLERANWWVHALLILVFPPLILRSKHFHILMAPVAIFLRTHELGDYLPLDLDMDKLAESDEPMSLGLETMADTPWKMRLDFLTCVECRRCTDLCPANGTGQELDPRGFILAGQGALGSDNPVIGTVITETALGQCTSCGACENTCPVGIEHLQVLIGAKRAQALSSGKGMVATEFLQTIERSGNPFGAATDIRRQLIESLALPIYEKGKTEYLLWLGCVWTYNEDARSSLEAMVRILKAAKVSWGVLETESCSGHHSRRQGEEMQFQTLAGENLERFREKEVKKIIAPCPHCLHTFRHEYPTLPGGLSVSVQHHSEFLAELVAGGRVKLRPTAGNGKVLTYHDPCYLGRYEKVFDLPRDLIARTGHPVRELARRREKSFCCGGGSAGFVREQKAERRVDQERKDEISASGANVLVTACPECKMMLGAAVEETLDVAELVASSLAEPS